MFEKEIRDSNFTLIDTGGQFVKPFADFQMKALMESGIIQKEQLDGLVKMAKRYPRLSGSIYAVAKKL